MSREDDLATLIGIAREAATIVARVYATDFAVEYKRPGDPVTEADRQANELIVDRLGTAFPRVLVVAEESAESFSGWAGADRVFFVDPLDGTREFVAKNGEFAVMIGLAEEGAATMGVVLTPADGTVWAGAVGLGAWEIDGSGTKTSIHVSDTSELGQARVVVSRSHRADMLSALLTALKPREVVPCGSAGVKAARVASGRADLYLQPGKAGKRWDACGPEALVRAAGGRFTNAWGEPIEYATGALENDRGFVVSNGVLHDDVFAALAARGLLAEGALAEHTRRSQNERKS